MYVPVDVVEATVKVIVRCRARRSDGRGTEAHGDAGRLAVAVKLIAELKPFKAAVVMVEVPVLPCTTVSEAGEAEMVKLADVGPASALIRPVPFGLPQPVTRS